MGQRFGLFSWHVAHPHGRKRTVFKHSHMRKQIELLEQHADFAADFFKIF